MQRKIERDLIEWKGSARRKPLIVNGARQVGKTYSILAFGTEHYAGCAHVDFSAQPAYRAIFEDDIRPSSLLPQIEALSRQQIDPLNTLLFFDEVQLCPRALTSLKYFAELAPDYSVIAAGSLLGVNLARGEQSFPVGKVDMLDMHPFDFEEFCWASGDERLAELIAQATSDPSAFALHETALERYHDYLLVGGMPEVVAAHVQGASSADTDRIKQSLITSYVADMTKYAPPIQGARILSVWNAVPEQLAKENHKFQYSTIASSARAHQYEFAIAWLLSAGMLNPCYRVEEPIHPLAAHARRDFFKLYPSDCGLLASLLGIDAGVLMGRDAGTAHIRGALAESYVAQQLRAQGRTLYYWGVASKSELDFVLDDDSRVIPIEVKSGTRVSSRSLEAYRTRYAPERIIRLSERNFGDEGGIVSLPLYAAPFLRLMLNH